MHDDPSRRSLSFTSLWVLRVVLLARSIGLGCSYLWHPMERESDIHGTLYFEWGWPESTAIAVENAGMWFIAVGAVVILMMNIVVRNQPKGGAGSLARVWRVIEIAMLAFFVFWEVAMAAGLTFRGGKFLSSWALGSHGLRIAVPASLLLHATGFGAKAATRILYAGTITTFLVHGCQAWLGSPVFITMIITTLQSYFDWAIEQSKVEQILKVIGVMDVCVVGVILLLARSRNVLRKVLLGTLLWMAFWGLVTAVGRTTGASFGTYPETLLRLVHLGGPLVLYLEWSRCLPSQPIGSSVLERQPNVHPLPTGEQPELF